MDTVISFIEAISALGPAGLVIATVFGVVLLVHSTATYNTYLASRRQRTTRRVMKFVEGTLTNIVNASSENALGLMNGHGGGTMGQEDRLELLAYNLASSEVLLNRIKYEIKDIVVVNGYFKLWKAGKHDEIKDLVRTRAEQLRNVAQNAVINVFRPDSPLIGLSDKRFPMSAAVTLMESIVARHCREMEAEEQDIRRVGNKKFPGFYKFFEYSHEDHEDLLDY